MSGRTRLVLAGVRLDNFIDTLLEWEEIAAERNAFPNWRRSPIERENRRESVVFGNCLETVKAYLGRRRVNELMEQARRAKAHGQSEAKGGAAKGKGTRAGGGAEGRVAGSKPRK